MLPVFIGTLVIFLGVIGVLLWVKTPRYQMQPSAVVRLLQSVLVGQASENDWAIFLASSFRHYPALEDIQTRCLAVDEAEYIGYSNSGYLFSAQGLTQLRELLDEVQSMLDDD